MLLARDRLARGLVLGRGLALAREPLHVLLPRVLAQRAVVRAPSELRLTRRLRKLLVPKLAIMAHGVFLLARDPELLADLALLLTLARQL